MCLGVSVIAEVKVKVKVEVKVEVVGPDERGWRDSPRVSAKHSTQPELQTLEIIKHKSSNKPRLLTAVISTGGYVSPADLEHRTDCRDHHSQPRETA